MLSGEDKFTPLNMTRAKCTYEFQQMSPSRPLLPPRTQQMMQESQSRHSPKSICHSRSNYPLQLYYGSPEHFLEEQLERGNAFAGPSAIHQGYPSSPPSGYVPPSGYGPPSMCGGEHVSWGTKDPKTFIDKNDPIYLYTNPSSEESEDYEEEDDEGVHKRNELDENATRSAPFKFRTKPRKPRRLGGGRRVMEKNGTPNIRYKNVSERRRRYISDFYTTLIDSNWSMTLLLFALSFYITWATFAVIYYFICWIHGDFLPENMPDSDKQAKGEWTPCILAMPDFASAFLFSLETQHTIGYGTRQTTNECPEAITVMSFQSVIGCLIQAFMVGLVFAKLSRPKHRANTVVFSKTGVVCVRDKQLCMIFRVGDMRHDSFIVGAQISLKLIRRRGTMQGEIFDEITPLKVYPNTVDESCLFLIWPLTVIHKIDEDSPFYKMNPNDLASSRFELSLTLEGTIESTSMTFQARTSYLPSEILWGNRFEPMILYRNEHKKYQVNFSAFDSTYELETPICSAYELDEVYKVKTKESSRKHASRGSAKPATPPQFHSHTPKSHPPNHRPRGAEEIIHMSQSNTELQHNSIPLAQPPTIITTNSSTSQDKTHSESSATSAASTCAEQPNIIKHIDEGFNPLSVSNENVPDI
eukprot:TRINITY_DN3706_c0_g1_i1.p1 TRINITY_DN3706_c0_g1~~TRINITY_DN3706_c0_g1_i1.p1  ORF type:complete len:641 (+),score=130.17 TRINITY_DN3706_c0_g1_i1:55-1977(+)